jgi:outer membrane protein assembly factor BamB
MARPRFIGGARRLGTLGLLAGLAVVASGCWYQAGFDPGHTSNNTSEATLGPANVSLIGVTGTHPFPSSASPSTDASAVYYPDAAGPSGTPSLDKVDRITNALIWSQSLGGPPHTPAVGNSTDGGERMVFTTYTENVDVGVLEARDVLTGALIWKRVLPGARPTSPTLAKISTPGASLSALFVTMKDTHIVVAVSTANVVLGTSLPAQYFTPVAVGPQFAYVGQTNGTVAALTLPGLAVGWVTPVSPAPIVGSPTVSGANVYAASLVGDVGQVDATTGLPGWSTSIPGFVLDAPAAGTADLLVTVDQGGFAKVFALQLGTGVFDWIHTPPAAGVGSGPIIANKVVYYFNGAATEALDLFTGLNITSRPTGVAHQEPIISQAHLYTPGGALTTYG